jgi:hypothetical protein
MRILVNHLTRMHGGHICLAGVDLETRRHVRPLLAHDPVPFFLLARYGGPFDMARIVDLGSPRHAPVAPHVEDHVFVPARARFERVAAADEFWEVLEDVECGSLQAIFGPALHEAGRQRWATRLGQGLRSLGVLCPATTPELYVASGRDGGPQVRMRLTDGQIRADAGVTDLRLFGDDHATPEPARIRAAVRGMADSQGVLLGVGLTRKFRSSDRHEYLHWLQVNNIHLKENAAWALG